VLNIRDPHIKFLLEVKGPERTRTMRLSPLIDIQNSFEQFH
jgi:hypothetical protein